MDIMQTSLMEGGKGLSNHLRVTELAKSHRDGRPAAWGQGKNFF